MATSKKWTQREDEIVLEMRPEANWREIAQKLKRSPKAVEQHYYRYLAKHQNGDGPVISNGGQLNFAAENGQLSHEEMIISFVRRALRDGYGLIIPDLGIMVLSREEMED